MTLALPERWTFAGVDLSSYATITSAATGADDFPQLRGQDQPLTGLDGNRSLGKLWASRRVPLVLFVSPLSATGVDGGQTQYLTNLDALRQVFAAHGQQTLTRLMPDGTTRSAQAECVSVASVSDILNHTAATLVAQFELADPLFYGASSTGPGSQATTSSPKDFTFTNIGMARGRKMTIDFTGPITNPRLTNLTTGAYVDVAAVVASSKHLIIDPYAFTVANDGVDAQGGLTHGSFVEWLNLDPGANSMRATSTSPGGSVLVTSFPGFM